MKCFNDIRRLQALRRRFPAANHGKLARLFTIMLEKHKKLYAAITHLNRLKDEYQDVISPKDKKPHTLETIQRTISQLELIVEQYHRSGMSTSSRIRTSTRTGTGTGTRGGGGGLSKCRRSTDVKASSPVPSPSRPDVDAGIMSPERLAALDKALEDMNEQLKKEMLSLSREDIHVTDKDLEEFEKEMNKPDLTDAEAEAQLEKMLEAFEEE